MIFKHAFFFLGVQSGMTRNIASPVEKTTRST